MVELFPDVPLNENNEHENSLLLYSDPAHSVRDFISREDDIELPDKSYGGSPNEICTFKLDHGKIDELANDYCAEITCVSSNRESAIQNEPYEEMVKNDGTSPRNEEDESRCKSNRGRKTRRKMPEGVIIDLSNDIYGTFRGGVKISVISMHNLPESKLLAKRHSRFSMWNRGARKKKINKKIDSFVLDIFYDKNCRNAKNSAKRKRKHSQKKLVDDTVRSDINRIVDVSNQLDNALSKQRESEDNLQSFCITDGIFDSKCHHDAHHNVQYSVPNAKQTCVGDMKKHNANLCRMIFDDARHEYHICDQKDYNADASDFNAEMQHDWMAGCFHSERRHAGGCRCSYVSNEYYPDINMQHDCCSSIPMRMARPLKNSALPKKHQRKEIKRFENIALEFATETDEYSPNRDERGNWCANCAEQRKSMASTIRKCVTSKTSGSDANLRDSSIVDASRCEIDTRLRERGRQTTKTTATMMGREGEQPNKSDSLKATDTRDTHARRDCIERCCDDRVAAVSSRAERSLGKKGGLAHGVDSKWKPGSIETDARQLDYKWKRRIATVDAGMRASVNFKRKRDSRYKSEEAIRVQLRESVEIRKRESLQMVEAMSQTRGDNTNANDKRRETRYYSLWTSLQIGKIWSQVHDACKNVVKLAATSVGRIVKDAHPKSECSPRNPVEVADTKALVESSSSCADKIYEETCRKNLMCLKSGTRLEMHHERAIRDTGERREDTEISMRKNPRAIMLSRHDMRKHVQQNAEKGEDEKSCVFYSEHERDRYWNMVKFPPQNETHGCDENVYPQFHLSGSFSYLENSAYPGLRNRGGSDDNRDFARRFAEDKQKSTQRTYDAEEAKSVRRHRDLIPKKCSCPKNQIIHMRYVGNQSSQHVIVSHETDCQINHTDVPNVSRNNPLDREVQLTSVSFPEDNRRRETHATPPTGSREKMEYKNIERVVGTETERKLTSETSKIVNATASSTNPAVYSSRNDPDEPIASTSKWETTPVSSGRLRENRPASRTPICTTAMKFWKRSAVANKKIIAPIKRRKSINRGKLSVIVGTTRDSKINIMQIEPSTVQIAQGGNKRQPYVNVQMQIPDTIVGRILSEFLVSGEKKKRVLMSITLQSDSNHDVSDGKKISSREAETQTSSNDVSSVATDTFDYPYGRAPVTITPTTKTVPCFVCDKQDCYEIKHSDDSITLEDALLAEYPETSELNDYIAKRKTDL